MIPILGRPKLEITQQGPLIIVKQPHTPRIVPKEELHSWGRCSVCQKPYDWNVMDLTEWWEDDGLEQEEKTRAFSLYKHYREKGIGPCCAKPADRTFIARWAGAVVYRR
jgi:hypothetical protein